MNWDEALAISESLPAAELTLGQMPESPQAAPTAQTTVAGQAAAQTELPASAEVGDLPVSTVPDGPSGPLDVSNAPEGVNPGELETNAPQGVPEASGDVTEPSEMRGETLEIAAGPASGTESLETAAPTPLPHEAREVSTPEAPLSQDLDTLGPPSVRGETLEIPALPNFTASGLGFSTVPRGLVGQLAYGALPTVSAESLDVPRGPSEVPGGLTLPTGFVPMDDDRMHYVHEAAMGGNAGDTPGWMEDLGMEFEEQLARHREVILDNLGRSLNEQQILLTMAESDE